METVKVKYKDTYRDGGTKLYVDENGKEYFKNNMIGTKTKGRIYDKYPGAEGAKIINVSLEIEPE